MKPSTTENARGLRPFSESLPMLLLRAREAVMLRFRGMLRQHDLTEQQWRVLRALSTDETFEIPRLAEATFLLGPSLSRILSDLGAEGLISVELHQADQRRKMIRLTRKGADLIALIAPLSEAIYADIARTLGADKMEQMQASLRDMEAALRKAASADGP